MKTIAVIPAYNEASTLAGVLESTRGFVDGCVVVDDGSTDRTAEIARAQGAVVVCHATNRGLGAAIGTGFEKARRLGADVVVTLDADGQHDPSQIPALLAAIEKGADVVIGSRMLERSGMPWYRVLANTLGNIATLVLFGAWVSDSQSGFRAFSAYALGQIEIVTNRMEVSSELIAEAKRHRLVLVEVPVKAIYTDYSLSKGQNALVGLKTLVKLIIRRMT
ncbi:glycosyltransferase family 2 protein [Candidatus Parcubacteria bacterium]|nr:glycosyltransferase family 2 protein [Candidatus Parcubacteria bacterium]